MENHSSSDPYKLYSDLYLQNLIIFSYEFYHHRFIELIEIEQKDIVAVFCSVVI